MRHKKRISYQEKDEKLSAIVLCHVNSLDWVVGALCLAISGPSSKNMLLLHHHADIERRCDILFEVPLATWHITQNCQNKIEGNDYQMKKRVIIITASTFFVSWLTYISPQPTQVMQPTHTHTAQSTY